ncbi:MAG: hypothetical protein ABID84_02290 [Chloroflexota bacterium]
MPHITDFPVGYEFAPIRFQLQPQEVALYLQAVGECNDLFQQRRFVPPTALAAYALRGILREMNLPPGALHSAQEISLSRPVASDQAIVFSAKLTRNLVQRGWRFVSVDFSGIDEDEKMVIRGKSTVVVPEGQGGDEE